VSVDINIEGQIAFASRLAPTGTLVFSNAG
jgi:hypothetical protein